MAFRRFAETSTRVLVNGIPGGVAWAPDGSPFAVLALTVRGGRIVAIDVLADPGPARPARSHRGRRLSARSPLGRRSRPRLLRVPCVRTTNRSHDEGATHMTAVASAPPPERTTLGHVFNPIARAPVGAPASRWASTGSSPFAAATSGLPRTTPVAIIDGLGQALGLGPVGRRPMGAQPARRRPCDHHRARPQRGGHARPSWTRQSESRSSATSLVRSRAGMPFGVRFIRMRRRGRPHDPVGAADGRCVFELQRVP